MFLLRSLCAIALTVTFGVCDAFAPVLPPRYHGVATFMSEPSDTSSDPFEDERDVMDVENEEFTPTDAESAVTNMFDILPSMLGEVSESERATINEVLLKLEALNPTENPTMSPLLNGVWELRYAAGYTSEGALPSPTRQLALFLYSGGYSPGLFALGLAQKIPASVVDVGDLQISICREQPRVEAKVDVKSFLGESSVVVKAQLEIASDVRMRETYESASVMDRVVELPELLRYSREIYVTYLDEDILVVRDGSGVPELLVRKEKIFRNWGTAPSDVDDTLAPGEQA